MELVLPNNILTSILVDPKEGGRKGDGCRQRVWRPVGRISAPYNDGEGDTENGGWGVGLPKS